MTDESKLPDPMSVGVASATFDPTLGRLYTVHALHAYAAALAASQAVAAVAEDAGRYRWLRSTQRFKHYLDGELVREEPIDPAVYDAAIDTAIAEAHEAVDAAIDAAMGDDDEA